jgi:hypothetical protein
MRFPKTFQRWVGGSQPANIPLLGSDAITLLNSTQTPLDCQFQTRLVNINGFPIQRIVVAYMPPTGVAVDPPLTASLYMQCRSQDDGTIFWVAVPSLNTQLTTCGLTFFDTPCITDVQNTELMKGSISTMLMLVVSTDPGATDGAHTFMVGADFSNPAFNT